MRPLVILHGLFGSSRNWKSVSKILSGLSENRDIRAIDLRNHNFYYGASRINGPMDSWEILHRDLENYWKKELNSEEFDILGHSFGGQIAMTSLLRKGSVLRNFVRKLVIVDVSLRHPSLETSTDKMFQLMEAMNYFEQIKCFDKNRLVEMLTEIESDKRVVDFLLLNLVKNEDGSLNFKNLELKYLIKAWPKLKEQWDQILKDQSVPWDGQVLFLKGDKSDYIRSDDLEKMGFYFPNFKLEIIKNSGHWPHFDNQVDFVNKVTKFL